MRAQTRAQLFTCVRVCCQDRLTPLRASLHHVSCESRITPLASGGGMAKIGQGTHSAHEPCGTSKWILNYYISKSHQCSSIVRWEDRIHFLRFNLWQNHMTPKSKTIFNQPDTLPQGCRARISRIQQSLFAGSTDMCPFGVRSTQPPLAQIIQLYKETNQ